jgi:ATP-dependent Clp protease ATP-binding subunit ClpA
VWETLAERAKRVLFRARYEAAVATSAQIEGLHLLHGILLEEDPDCVRVIRESGAKVEALAELVRRRLRETPNPRGRRG